MGPHTTHTFAILDVSSEAFDEIREKLVEAGYQHAIHGGPRATPAGVDQQHEVIDMNGIALAKGEPREDSSSWVRTVEIAKCPSNLWHDLEVRAKFLNALARIANFMLPEKALFVLTIFGDNQEGSYVSNCTRESSIAGIRDLADKLERGETYGHGPEAQV